MKVNAKKKVRSNPINRYNKLFKFLSFDQGLLSCLLITIIILLYTFAILGVFSSLEIPAGAGEAVIS
ncbi:hypothetical protein [endosymbiont DhMRE of Dentiscutata heterogama]|uniref:hypothetical protein n=1 Tax=endosymbiont DhMRE of Dentiscutata heterogama TaxID=1609546 RepID=UPI002AD4B33E|nr:hypothetical protein [endosymbiont DhMRE of Dentiscutata heterogama]